MNKLNANILKQPVHLLAFGFGSGLAPKAPGTFGTLAVIPFYLLMASYLSHNIYIAITVIVSLAGIYICDRSSKILGVHDHPGIVWDEFAGFLITMIAVPLTWYWLLTGFLLFRFFDILKPWPIKVIDKKIAGGLGIMLDDILAGIFALIIMHALIWGVANV